MTLFLVLAAVAAIAAVLTVVLPLLRPKAVEDAAGGLVTPSRAAAITVAVLMPLAAFATYFTLSEWPWDDSTQTQAGHAGGSDATLPQMASQLEQRLAREQGDTEGWKMLGRTYVVMGDFPKALTAYQKAYTLTSGQDIDALLGYAEARVLVDESDFEGEAGQLFERAIQIAPSEPRALWYGGLTAFRKQDLDTARNRWAALREQGAPPEILQILDARIAEIDSTLGRPAEQAAASGTPPMMAAAAAPSAAQASPAVAADDAIPLRIVVAPELAGKVPPDTPLFVLARGAAGGPPLAAVRRSSSELPLSITLSDANAMIPGTSLKQVDALTIVARVSLSGRPVASSGDLFGEVRYDPASPLPITVTINRSVD